MLKFLFFLNYNLQVSVIREFLFHIMKIRNKIISRIFVVIYDNV